MSTTVEKYTAPGGGADYNSSTNQSVNNINAARSDAVSLGAPSSVVNQIGRGTAVGTTPPVTVTNGKSSLVPVVTSKNAQNDLAQKQAGFAAFQAANAAQAAQLAQQKLAEQQAQTAQAQLDREQKNTQAGIDQKNQEIAAKNAALGIATAPTTPPGAQNAPVTNANTPNVQSGTPTSNTSSNTGTSNPSGLTGPSNGTDTVGQANNGLVTTTNDLTGGLQDIQNARDALTAKINTQLSSVLKGTFPLTGPQQDLITSLQTQLNQQVAEQKVANDAYTGAVAESGFRSGAEYTPSQYAGQIANAVSYGVSKIQNLDNSASKTMADLEQSFQKDDYEMITKNYDILDKQLAEKGDHIKTMFDAVTSTLKDQRDFQVKQQEAADKKVQDQRDFDEKVKEFAANQKLDEKKYGLDAAKYQHQLEVDASTGVNSVDDAGLTMLARGYLTSGTLPAVGYGKQAVAMRTAIINKAVALSGGADNVDPAVNKAAYDANRAVLKSQQQNYTVADTAYRIFDKNGDLALSLAKGLNNSNSPIINQLSNSVINQTTGQGQLDSYKAVLTSLQSEYATLINVKGGGGGQVTEGDKQKAEKAIPMDISPKRLQEVLTNLKTEGANVLSERKQTLDQLNQNITTHASTFNDKVADKPLVGQVSSAKAAGYSSNEIVSNLANNPQYKNAVSSAKALGYSDDEIINYLTK